MSASLILMCAVYMQLNNAPLSYISPSWLRSLLGESLKKELSCSRRINQNPIHLKINFPPSRFELRIGFVVRFISWWKKLRRDYFKPYQIVSEPHSLTFYDQVPWIVFKNRGKFLEWGLPPMTFFYYEAVIHKVSGHILSYFFTTFYWQISPINPGWNFWSLCAEIWLSFLQKNCMQGGLCKIVRFCRIKPIEIFCRIMYKKIMYQAFIDNRIRLQNSTQWFLPAKL